MLAAAPDDIAPFVGTQIAAGLAAAQGTMTAALREQFTDCARPTLDDLVTYLRCRMAYARYEELYAFYLASDLSVLRDELVTRGTRTRCPFEPSQIIRRALELDAHALIVAHNHPSGSLTPSQDDIAATKLLAARAQSVELRLLDHLVITRRGWTSLRAEGMM